MGREVFGSKQETVVHTRPSWQCSAYGCRLPGGLSQGFGPEARYYCRFHYGKEPFENDAITRILHEYDQVFDAIYAIKEVPDVQRIGMHMKSIGRQDLGPKADEVLMPHYYRDRLLKEIGKEISEEIKNQKEARTPA